MKTLEKKAESYAEKYPPELREVVMKAWLDGHRAKTQASPIDYSFVDDAYLDIFTYWADYRKELGKKLTQKSAVSAYRKLVEYSRGDVEVMKQIVEQSVSNGWTGIFELKSYGRYNKNRGENQSIFDASDSCLQRNRQ